jgi:hypothetical protein
LLLCQARNYFRSFGIVRFFHAVRDTAGMPTGTYFFEFQNASITGSSSLLMWWSCLFLLWFLYVLLGKEVGLLYILTVSGQIV